MSPGRVAQQLGEAAAGEIGADRLVVPQAVDAQAVQAQGGAGEQDQQQRQALPRAKSHGPSVAQAGVDPKLPSAGIEGFLKRVSSFDREAAVTYATSHTADISLSKEKAVPATALALVPHPDDAEFYAGGLLAKLIAEDARVYIVVATDGRRGSFEVDTGTLIAARAEEMRRAAAALGAEPPILLGYPDGELDTLPAGVLREQFIRVIRQLRPDVVVAQDPYAALSRTRIIAPWRGPRPRRWTRAPAAVSPRHLAEAWPAFGGREVLLRRRSDADQQVCRHK